MCGAMDNGLVPESSEGGWYLDGQYCCSSYEETNPFSPFTPFFNSFIGDNMNSPMVGCKYLPLYCKALTGPLRKQSYQDQEMQAFLGLHDSVGV